MLYLFGQLAKLSIGAIRSIPSKMIQSQNIGICWYLVGFVVSVVSYQDVGYTVVFLFRKLLKLCVSSVRFPWFQVVVEALLAKHGDLSAQDQSGATPSGAPSVGLVEPVEPLTIRGKIWIFGTNK